MTAPAESRRGIGRMWLGVVMVLAIQIGFIFALSDRTPFKPHPPAPATVVRLTDSRASAFLEVDDPTLFALPHPRGFSGAARLKSTGSWFPPMEWNAPAFWLPLPVQELVSDFKGFAETNHAPVFQTVVQLPVQMTIPSVPATVPLANRSRLRIEGALKTRELASKFTLRSWPSAELLSNSVVRVDVDARGHVFSPVLLQPSGLADADQFALDLARRARFAPLADAGRQAGWNSGLLVFEWETSPPSLTNGASANP